MALNFDEVGRIFQEACEKIPKNGHRATMEARRIIGESIFEQMGFTDLMPEAVALLRKINILASEAGIYLRFTTDLKFGDLAPEVLGFMQVCHEALVYVDTHWDELPDEQDVRLYRRSDVRRLITSLHADIAYHTTVWEREQSITVGHEFFGVIQDIISMACALVLGNDRAIRMLTQINGAMVHPRTHARIAWEASRILENPKSNAKES